jgi:anti-sigma factor RsiW
MSPTDDPSATPAEGHPEIEAQFTDLEEGALTPAEAEKIRTHLADCARCASAHAEFRRTLAALAGLGKVGAPPTLPTDVARTIHRRSGGRFFGRRAFGDRVPFELLALAALIVLAALALILRGSMTGSLR